MILIAKYSSLVPVDVGPASFIDSERVNAGSDLDNAIDDNILAHLPVSILASLWLVQFARKPNIDQSQADLWREDIEGIKHEKKIRVTKESSITKQP